jgi:hypothetical protein
MSDLVERIGAEIFRFQNPGDFLRGILTEIETVEIGGKPTLKYLIHDPDEKRLFSVLGTIDLNTKIRQSDVGRLLEIRYEGTEKIPGRYPIKRFRVFGK